MLKLQDLEDSLRVLRGTASYSDEIIKENAFSVLIQCGYTSEVAEKISQDFLKFYQANKQQKL